MYPDDENTTRVVLVPNPAAGAGFTYTIEQSEWQVVRAVCFKLVASVQAATRTVYLDFLEGAGGTIARHSSGYTNVASDTSVFTFGAELNVYGANSAASIGCPLLPLWLKKGQKISVTATNIQTADQFSAIYVTLDQVASDEALRG